MIYHESKQEIRDLNTKELIEATLAVHPAYGHKRIALELGINKKRVLRVMKKYAIKPYRRKKKPWKKAVSSELVHPNLLKNIDCIESYRIWCMDFTYLWYQGRFIYVATVLDIYTREILGVSIGTRHTTSFVIEALVVALMDNPKPDIVHDDQGSEFTSHQFNDFCDSCGIALSMSDKGSPWQNGYQESFYDKFKVDLGDPSRFESLGELIYCIHQTIHYYNHDRIHTKLKMPPKKFAALNQRSYTTPYSKDV